MFGEVTTVNLFAEGFHNNSNAKFTIDGTGSTWNGNDNVRVNNAGRCNVSVTDGEKATISGSFTTPLRAVSPYNLTNADLTSDAVTLQLPLEYTYSTYGLTGKQHLQSPMAAYAASGSDLHFKHLTGALTVKVTNSTGATFYLESISVTSDKYQLGGSRVFNFSNLSTIAPVETSDAALRTVTMNFETGSTTLANAASMYVQIPVLPVGTGNHFTVTVRYRHYGNDYLNGQHCYTRILTQSDKDNHLDRAELGYVPMTATTSGDGVTASYFFQSADGYNIIADRWQLRTLSNVSSSMPNHSRYRITNDIPGMTGYTIDPIENVAEIDGGGHSIKNLTINTVDGYCGLVKNLEASYPTSPSIHDLTLNNVILNVGSGATRVGAFAAQATQPTLSNCAVTGLLTMLLQGNNNNEVYAGGLIGAVYNAGNTSITHCSVADIKFNQNGSFYTGASFCGGIIGYFQPQSSNLSIQNCSVSISQSDNYVQATGLVRFGGLVGYLNSNDHRLYLTIANNTVNITNLTVTSTSSSCHAGAWIGTVMQTNSGWTMGNGGNSTTGSISAYASTSANVHVGNASNKQVCSGTTSQPDAIIPLGSAETASQLQMTISTNTL